MLFDGNVGKLKASPDGKFYGCFSCGLNKKVLHPRMTAFGNFAKKILIIRGFPTAQEDYTGNPWSDKPGMYLKRMFAKQGIDVFNDCVTTYAVQCKPDNIKGQPQPKVKEIMSCRKRLYDTIRKYKPTLIFALGVTALKGLYGERWKKGSFDMNKWQGWHIPDQELESWVVPLFDAPTLYKQKHFTEVEIVWKNAVKSALNLLNKEFPVYSLQENNVELIDRDAEIFRFLNELQKVKIFAWDTETTGLKPYKVKEHAIRVISFAYEDEKAYVIKMPKSPKVIAKLKSILGDAKIRKIAHNMKFENLWAAVWLGVDVKGWYWDTMQMAHILNNTPGISGLKFQTFVRFGVDDYDSEVAPFLKAKDEQDSHATNRIDELMKNPEGRRKLMLYCGYDSLNTWRLFKLQKQEV